MAVTRMIAKIPKRYLSSSSSSLLRSGTNRTITATMTAQDHSLLVSSFSRISLYSAPQGADVVSLQQRFFSSSGGNSEDDDKKKQGKKENNGGANNNEEEGEETARLQDISSLQEEEEKEEEEKEEEIPEPSSHDLKLVALAQAIPFVGFGVMDNAILILAGDAIDTSLGVTLGISTLCAAAIGNIISDLAGVMLGTAIEDFAAKLNLPTPNINAAQRTLRSVRFAGQAGCAVGITIGCIIGMFPLMFIDSNKVQKQKKEAHMDTIFRDVMTEAKHLTGSEQTRLFLVVDSPTSTTLSSSEKKSTTAALIDSYLYCKYVDDDDDDESDVRIDDKAIKRRKTIRGGSISEKDRSMYLPVGKGIVSRAVLTGEAVNIYDARTEPDFVPEENILCDGSVPVNHSGVKSMICVPVFDLHGNVIAVIQALNKVSEGSSAHEHSDGGKDWDRFRRSGFTSNDVQVLQALASHVSVSLQDVDEEDVQLSLKNTIKILKEQGTSGLDQHDVSSSSEYSQRRPLFPEIEPAMATGAL